MFYEHFKIVLIKYHQLVFSSAADHCQSKYDSKIKQRKTNSLLKASQRTLTMFLGVVALRYQHHGVLITECHNSHKHSQSPLTS